MTVGIAAISQSEDETYVLLSADRLVTSGYGNPIEYEHTESKLREITEAGDLTAMGVASGSLSLADDIFRRIENHLVDTPPNTIRELAELGVDAYHEMQQEAFNNQKLEGLGLSLDDFKNDNVNLAPKFQEAILSDVYDLKERIENDLTIIIAGVDKNGGHIYSIGAGDLARHDHTGYLTIGSGSKSAQLTFTRNRYDKNCDLQEGLLYCVEAKSRAEEAQGVGKRMDISVMTRDGFDSLIEDEIKDLNQLMEEIERAERDARETTIAKHPVNYAHGGNS